ncbi:hypothetical protein AMK32_22295 [Streptomyces sp. CB01883]|nr:hypothetical protein AMK32_22295 [Streptomyces sp. CB01883]
MLGELRDVGPPDTGLLMRALDADSLIPRPRAIRCVPGCYLWVIADGLMCGATQLFIDSIDREIQ